MCLSVITVHCPLKQDYKPTLFYVYDETEYHDQRGLNQFYWTIPEVYKVR